MPKIVNLVLTAALGRHVNLQALANRFPHKVRYDPENPRFPGALIRIDRRVSLRLFPTGRIIMTGPQNSPTVAKQRLIHTVRELGFRRPRTVALVNMVATWTLAPRDEDEMHEVGSAYVKVSRTGKVFCTGVTSRQELKHVVENIQ